MCYLCMKNEKKKRCRLLNDSRNYMVKILFSAEGKGQFKKERIHAEVPRKISALFGKRKGLLGGNCEGEPENNIHLCLCCCKRRCSSKEQLR